MSLSSSSQNATKIASQQKEDSIICLPKRFINYTVTDLIKYDATKELTKLLSDSICIQNIKLEKQTAILNEYKKKSLSYEYSIFEYEMVVASNKKALDELNNKNIK